MTPRLTAGTNARWRNADVNWDSWPVDVYLRENYSQLHACDDAVLVHHSGFYRRFAPGSIGRSLELGAGPNLYPLMVAGAASRLIHAIDHSCANVAYLNDQLRNGADDTWKPFYERCRVLNPALPTTLTEALARVRAKHGDVQQVPADTYDLASMNFVAESISEDLEEVATFCRAFLRSVRPGGHLVAAFMENQSRYSLGNGSHWPGCPIDVNDVREIFEPHTKHLTISRIEADPALPDHYGGYTGMIMCTARRTS